jgi:hypothetical protein
LGFGVVTIIGIDPDEARVGNVAVEIAHNGFYTHVQDWLKLRDAARGWGRPQSYRGNMTTLHTLRRVSPSFPERHRSVPRIGNIWIPKFVVLPNHFTILYILGVEDLFKIGDHLLRVEHCGSRSRVISWRIWRNPEERWQFQQESTDEQSFSTFPSNVVPLRPIVEGDQFEFSN